MPLSIHSKCCKFQSPQTSLLSVLLDEISLFSFTSFVLLFLISKSCLLLVSHKVGASQSSFIFMTEVRVEA